jgi:hypothetical protein
MSKQQVVKNTGDTKQDCATGIPRKKLPFDPDWDYDTLLNRKTPWCQPGKLLWL